MLLRVLTCLVLLWPAFLPGAWLAWAGPAPVEAERIVDFHSDITLEDDASLQVTETITVFAAGNQIRHGIYREFPTRYTDSFNNHYVVGFEMLAATRDSAPERFRVEDYANGKRIYLGDGNSILPKGRHVYTITYSTSRQLGFFKDHDELFWNVTGLGWGFPMDQASATVHLPAAIPAASVTLSGYTGPKGSLESKLTTSTEEPGYQFAATCRLGPHEGLTILVSFPAGYFTPPTFAEKVQFFFNDNREALLLTIGFLIVFLYYITAWSMVGRDPERGVIMPLYQPPANLSPAAMRYLLRMGFDDKTFAAAILDMAVRGFIQIKEQDGSYTLQTTGKDNRILTPDEKQIASVLFDGRYQISLAQENHVIIRAALTAVKKWLAAAEQKAFFVSNSVYLVPPVLLSIGIVFANLFAKGTPLVVGGVLVSFWLTMWTIGLYGLWRNVFRAWREVFLSRRSAGAEVASAGKAFFLTVITVPYCFGEFLGFAFLLKITSLVLMLFLLSSVILHLVFLNWMKAPTLAGRRLMDQVEGFRMFLGAVEGDRLNRAAPPQRTPEVFEKFLPYALALDVEQDWAEKFSGALGWARDAPGNRAPGYTPSFYSGPGWNGFGGAGFASSFSTSLSSAIASSAAAPGSGAGGGGGGSGGGGGGGGGGGW